MKYPIPADGSVAFGVSSDESYLISGDDGDALSFYRLSHE